MSATLTDWGREQLLGTYLSRDTYNTTPAGLWVAYSRTIPVRNAEADQLDEPSSGAYARAPIGALTSANWAFSGFAEFYNLNTVTFPAPTGDWGLQLGFAILDSATLGAGHVFAVGPIIEPEQILSGDSAPSIPPAGIVVGLYD